MVASESALAQAKVIFERAPFITQLGVKLAVVEAGRCRLELAVETRHHQQHGLAHAGLLATLADHAAGIAATTCLEPGFEVLSAEFKINLLRPASASQLVCEARVLKPGRRLIIAESEIFGMADPDRLLAKATVTLAVLPKST